MKYTDFQNLTVISGGLAQIDALSAGTYFLWGASQEKQLGDYSPINAGLGGGQRRAGTDLRHKIHYYRRITDEEYPQGVVKKFVQEFDILESDQRPTQSKTPTRKGQDTNAARDDDDRRRILTDPDWS